MEHDNLVESENTPPVWYCLYTYIDFEFTIFVLIDMPRI